MPPKTLHVLGSDATCDVVNVEGQIMSTLLHALLVVLPSMVLARLLCASSAVMEPAAWEDGAGTYTHRPHTRAPKPKRRTPVAALRSGHRGTPQLCGLLNKCFR